MSDIGQTFTHKLGPLPAWAWAAIGGGLGLLYIIRKQQANAATAQSPVGTGTLPVNAIDSGGGGGGSTGTGTTTPTTIVPTQAWDTGVTSGPVSGFTPPQLNQAGGETLDQYAQLANAYEQQLAAAMNKAAQEAVAVAPPLSYPNPQQFQQPVALPVGPASIPQQAYSPYQGGIPTSTNPQLLHYLGGPLNGMFLPAQNTPSPSQVSGLLSAPVY